MRTAAKSDGFRDGGRMESEAEKLICHISFVLYSFLAFRFKLQAEFACTIEEQRLKDNEK